MSADDPLIGTVIDGRFEIKAKLGAGGMGVVYRALQRSVMRDVALKLIDAEEANDVTAVKRFLREAKLASKLSHPHAIQIIDFGQTADGQLFIAMELLKGRTLDLVWEDGPMPVARVMKLASQVCDALVSAHKQQFVHRDLKLENVMLLDDRDDFIKVLDFGLAKSLGDVDPKHERRRSSTRIGIVVGTPQYLPPETMTGQPATISNDLYALGVMMAELATGKEVWTADSMGELYKLKAKAPPLLLDVDEPLRELIRRLLAPAIADRPADGAVVADALANVASPPPVPMVSVKFAPPPLALAVEDLPRKRPPPMRAPTPLPVREQPQTSRLWRLMMLFAVLGVAGLAYVFLR